MVEKKLEQTGVAAEGDSTSIMAEEDNKRRRLFEFTKTLVRKREGRGGQCSSRCCNICVAKAQVDTFPYKVVI